MRYGSLFTGVGGFDLGFERAGMVCVWQAEKDKYCLDLLNSRWPQVHKYEDVHNVGKQSEAIDLVCGGFPCQDLSVAGKRTGLAGERSGLWREFVRVLAELRPRWVVIENVPGLLSSNKGRDMGILTGKLAELGYWWAYRVLDSKNFGVPQRRRRVFIVGNNANPTYPTKVLFERESSAWDNAESEEEGADVAPPTTGTITGGGKGKHRIGETLQDARSGLLLASYALNGSGYRLDGTVESFIPEFAKPLQASGGIKHREDMQTLLAFSPRKTNYDGQENISPPLMAGNGVDGGNGPPAVAWHGAQITSPENSGGISAELAPTMNGDSRLFLGVRRFTPLECERLQGFPDGWTEGFSDTQRYKMLGNAVTVNVAQWIAERIVRLGK